MNIIQNNTLLEKQNIAGFILKPNGSDIKDIYLDIKKKFESFSIIVLLDIDSSKTLGLEDGLDFKELCKRSDFLVTLGGDGTLISVARRGFKYQKAVMGINLGTLGFLTDIMPNELESFLNEFQKNNYRIDHRMMIKAHINNKEVVAFNDVVISRKSVTGMIKVDAKIEDKLFNKYNGDGLIISTPTGSTAYNLSCNGPVVYPLTDAFIVTPISAHSLTQRPLVLPVDFKISFENTNIEDAVVIIDGHDTYTLKQNNTLTIQIASSKAKLIHRVERNYFDVLNKKLHWGAN
ncbi:MAG: NAD(+)/NADH kinase [Campylobacterota bacterium]|nr:NAD(+)/NADH kinase [Campylobacterota bacterium]